MVFIQLATPLSGQMKKILFTRRNIRVKCLKNREIMAKIHFFRVLFILDSLFCFDCRSFFRLFFTNKFGSKIRIVGAFELMNFEFCDL